MAKRGQRPRYPHAFELRLRKYIRTLFGPVTQRLKSAAFEQAIGALLTKYRKDGLPEDLDLITLPLSEQWEFVDSNEVRRELRTIASNLERWNEDDLVRSAAGSVSFRSDAVAGRRVNFRLSDADLGIKRETLVTRAAGLIRGLAEEQRKRVRDAILQGLQAGSTPASIAESLVDVADLPAKRAEFIARDQVGSYNAALTEARMEAAGVDKFIWSTSLDERVRASHAELEGQVFEWSDPPTIDGEKAIPGQPINCRCVAIPVFE